MMLPFVIGDVVKLKSGGPLMTVIEVTDKGWVTCIWFDDNKHVTHTFPIASLFVVEQGD